MMDERGGVPVLADLVTALRRDSSGRRRLQSGGVLIAFEGGEGAGKSSQITLLAEAVRATGRTVVVTHEPGATALGRQIRRLLLDSDEPISPRSEALLFAADRAQHVAAVIRPALDRGEVVITDRFVDSSLAYQGAGRTLAVEEVKRLSRWATEELVPDLTVLLDVPAEIGLARARRRQAGTGAGIGSVVWTGWNARPWTSTTGSGPASGPWQNRTPTATWCSMPAARWRSWRRPSGPGCSRCCPAARPAARRPDRPGRAACRRRPTRCRPPRQRRGSHDVAEAPK